MAAAVPLRGQQSAWDSAPHVFLASDHWLVPELARLHALGLLPEGIDASQRVPTQAQALRQLARARDLAEERDPSQAVMIDHLRARLRNEAAIGDVPAAPSLGGAVQVGWAGSTGLARTGWGYRDGYPQADWHGAEVRADERGALWSIAIHAQPFDWLTSRVRLGADPSTPDADPSTVLEEAYVALDGWNLIGWAGVRPIGYGPARSGGIVLSGGVPLPSAGVRTDRPFRLPWVFRHLGPVSLELMLGERDFSHSFEDVGVLVTRGTVTPHPRFQLGVTRAALFGGSGNTSVDALDVFFLLIGKHAGDVSELENQVVSVDAQYRLPTERWLPVRVYVEWGFEDSANAWRDVPGILAGIEAPSLPGFRAARIGVEYATFAQSCCGNPIWYRHAIFQDGWAVEGVSLGHPLAGHGHAWSLLVGGALFDGFVHIDGELFRRHRRHENPLDPVRLGVSRGVRLEVNAALAPRFELIGRGVLEDGSGWRESVWSLGLRTIL